MRLVPLILLLCVACSGGPDEGAPDAGSNTPPDAGTTCRNLAREFDAPEWSGFDAITADGDRLYFSSSGGGDSTIYALPVEGDGPEMFLAQTPYTLRSLALDDGDVWTIEARDDGTTALQKFAWDGTGAALLPDPPWTLHPYDRIQVRPDEIVVPAYSTEGEVSTLLAFAKDGSRQRALVTADEVRAHGAPVLDGDEVWFFSENGVVRRPIDGDVFTTVSPDSCSGPVFGATYIACRSGAFAVDVLPRAGGVRETRIQTSGFELRGLAWEGDVLWAIAEEFLDNTFESRRVLLRSDTHGTTPIVCGPVGTEIVVTPGAIVTWRPTHQVLYFLDR